MLISRSADACQEYNDFSSGRAPDDARWLELGLFCDLDGSDALGRPGSCLGVHTLPATNKDAVVARYCKGETFEFGYFGWLALKSDGGSKIQAEAGTITVSAYSEGQYVLEAGIPVSAAGSYDLYFPGGAHVRGVFDAGWCK